MQKQSYAHLEFGFWIEWRNLVRWGERTLWPESLSTVRRLYYDAEVKRQSHGSQSIQRLAAPSTRRTPAISPPLCIPFSAPAHDVSAPCQVLKWRYGSTASTQESRPWTISQPTWRNENTPTDNVSPPCLAFERRNDSTICAQRAPTFIIPRKGNVAIPIKVPSLKKQQAMNGSWRVAVAA